MPYINLADYVQNQNRENQQKQKDLIQQQMFQTQQAQAQRDWSSNHMTAYETANLAQQDQEWQQRRSDTYNELKAKGFLQKVDPTTGGDIDNNSPAPQQSPASKAIQQPFDFMSAGQAQTSPSDTMSTPGASGGNSGAQGALTPTSISGGSPSGSSPTPSGGGPSASAFDMLLPARTSGVAQSQQGAADPSTSAQGQSGHDSGALPAPQGMAGGIGNTFKPDYQDTTGAYRWTTPDERDARTANLAKQQADQLRQQGQQNWAASLKAMQADPTMSKFLQNHQDTVNALSFQKMTGVALPDTSETKAFGDILSEAHSKTENGDTAGAKQLMDLYQQSKQDAHPATLGVSALSGPALDQAAHRFAMTGVMPPAGMGAAGQATRVAIMNRSAELHPNADIGANAAAYSANKSSMTASLRTYDAMDQYERTAGDNLNLFLGQAKKVVDSGSPWINTPLREINSKLLGNQDLPAYNAARQVAVNEIARVTSNPGLAGQLTDSARKEVSNFNPDNATFAQTVHVAQVLKQDMTNRKAESAQQLQNQAGRFKVGGIEGIRGILGEDANPTPGTTDANGEVVPPPIQPDRTTNNPTTPITPPPPLPRPIVKGQKIDDGTRDKYVQLFGGDRKAAQQAAQTAGWDTTR